MKLTLDKIDSLIIKTTFYYHGTLTICVLDLVGGANVTGESNVIDSSNYKKSIGEDIAFENARDKIWQLEGYAMKTRDFND